MPRLSAPAQVIRTFGLLPEEAVEELEALGLRVSAAAAAVGHEDDLYADAPEDFVDQLTGAVMEDPMTLPKSGVTLDRTSIMRHLLSSQTDPFSRRGCLQCAPPMCTVARMACVVAAWIESKLDVPSCALLASVHARQTAGVHMTQGAATGR